MTFKFKVNDMIVMKPEHITEASLTAMPELHLRGVTLASCGLILARRFIADRGDTEPHYLIKFVGVGGHRSCSESWLQPYVKAQTCNIHR